MTLSEFIKTNDTLSKMDFATVYIILFEFIKDERKDKLHV